MARRNSLRRAPSFIVSISLCARLRAMSNRVRSPALAAARNSVRMAASGVVAVAASRTNAVTATSRDTAALFRPSRLRAEHPRRLDQFLNRGLVFSARLEQIDPDRVSDRHQRVGRIGIELFQPGDQLESADF